MHMKLNLISMKCVRTVCTLTYGCGQGSHLLSDQQAGLNVEDNDTDNLYFFFLALCKQICLSIFGHLLVLTVYNSALRQL